MVGDVVVEVEAQVVQFARDGLGLRPLIAPVSGPTDLGFRVWDSGFRV